MPTSTGDRQLSINIRAVTSDLTTGLNAAKTGIRGWQTTTQDSIAAVEASTERMSRLWRSAFEAFLGFQAVDMLKKIALGAAEAADQLDVAARVAANFGHALDPAGMEKWLEQFARSAAGGGYAIDDMRKSVQLFASLGEDTAQIQRAIADTAQLAAARNMDWATAAHVVQMALTGHVAMLTRYGVISVEAAKKIKTVEQAMEALEKATKGAAEQRAENLIGSFGRLATAAELLGVSIGTALMPFFQTVTNLLTNLAALLDRIPQPVLNVAGTIIALVTSLAALALVLPAISKGIQIIGEGLRLFSVLVGPAAVLVGRLAATLGLATGGFEAFTAAEIAAAAPIAAIVVAIAGVVVAIAEMVRHMDHVKDAWHDWTQYLSDSFHEFTTNFSRDASVLVRTMNAIATLAMDTATYQVGKWKQDIANIVMTAAPKTAIREGGRLGHDDAAIGKDIVNDWRAAAHQIVGFIEGLFSTTLGKIPPIPREPFGGTTGKTAKDTTGAAAENAFKNFDESVKTWLAEFASRVDDAKAQVDIAGEKLADFDVLHPSNVPMSADDQAKRQALVNAQLATERDLRARLLDQQIAEKQAAGEYLKAAEQISANLKNHDALVRQALNAAREHAKAAQQVYLAYLQAGTALDTLTAKERAAANQRIDDAAQAADDTDAQALAARNLQRDLAGEQAGQALAVDKARGRAGPGVKLEEDRLKVQLDQLAVAAAVDAEAIKQEALARARLAYDQTHSVEDANRLREAQNALTQATLTAIRAEDTRAADEQQFLTDQRARWTNFIDDLVSKANAPGLSANAGAVSFNPLEFFLAVIEKTRSFADVMTTVTQITEVFARMLDALKPIIDALLDVIRAVVNVFIFLYNTVARILDLFGLQIQQLQYLTAAIGGLVPLIEIWHEIPTLNELAAGRLNSPLSTIPQGINSLGQSSGGQNGLMRVVEILTGILAAIIIEKLISGMSLTQAVQSTLHLMGINVGQKVQTTVAQTGNALTIQTNSILATGFTTMEGLLQALITATQSASGGGLFGARLSLGGGAASGGVGFLGAAGIGLGGPLGGLGPALKGAGEALRSHIGAINAATSAFTRLVSVVGALTEATGSATRYLAGMQSPASLAALSSKLSLDTSRRYLTGVYQIDRVPS